MADILFNPNNPGKGYQTKSKNPNFFNPNTPVGYNTYAPGLTNVDRSSKYDEGYNPYTYTLSQEDWRSQQQGWLTKWGSATARFAPLVVTKTLGGFSDAIASIYTPFSGATLAENLENPFRKAIDSLEEGLKEEIPIYHSDQYTEGNFWDKLGTAEFWADDAVDGAAFLASSLLGSGLVAKAIGGTAKAISGIGKVGSWIDEAAQSASIGTKLKALDQMFGSSWKTRAVKTAYSTLSEAGTEAYHINQDIRKELNLKRELGQKGLVEFKDYANLSDDEIRKRAGEAAAKTFAWNSAVLIAPNFMESGWFMKKSGNYIDDMMESMNKLGKTDKNLTNPYAAKGWGETLKNFGSGFAAEGLWEENIQESVTNYYKNYYTRPELDANSSDLAGVLGNYAKGVKGFIQNMTPFTGETQAGTNEDAQSAAILLGGIMGGPSQAWTKRLEEVSKMNQWDELKNSWWKNFNNMKSYANNALVEEYRNPMKPITKKVKDADGNEIEVTGYIDDNGEISWDNDKASTMVNRQFSNLIDAVTDGLAKVEGNPWLEELNKNNAIFRVAYELHNSKLSKTEKNLMLEDMLDSLEDSQEEDIQRLKQNFKSKFEQFSKIIENTENENKSFRDLEKDSLWTNFVNDLNKVSALEKIKRFSLEQVLLRPDLQSDDKAREEIQKYIDSSKEWESTFKVKDKGTNERFKEYESIYGEEGVYGVHKKLTEEKQTILEKLNTQKQEITKAKEEELKRKLTDVEKKNISSDSIKEIEESLKEVENKIKQNNIRANEHAAVFGVPHQNDRTNKTTRSATLRESYFYDRVMMEFKNQELEEKIAQIEDIDYVTEKIELVKEIYKELHGLKGDVKLLFFNERSYELLKKLNTLVEELRELYSYEIEDYGTNNLENLKNDLIADINSLPEYQKYLAARKAYQEGMIEEFNEELSILAYNDVINLLNSKYEEDTFLILESMGYYPKDDIVPVTIEDIEVGLVDFEERVEDVKDVENTLKVIDGYNLKDVSQIQETSKKYRDNLDKLKLNESDLNSAAYYDYFISQISTIDNVLKSFKEDFLDENGNIKENTFVYVDKSVLNNYKEKIKELLEYYQNRSSRDTTFTKKLEDRILDGGKDLFDQDIMGLKEMDVILDKMFTVLKEQEGKRIGDIVQIQKENEKILFKQIGIDIETGSLDKTNPLYLLLSEVIGENKLEEYMNFAKSHLAEDLNESSKVEYSIPSFMALMNYFNSKATKEQSKKYQDYVDAKLKNDLKNVTERYDKIGETFILSYVETFPEDINNILYQVILGRFQGTSIFTDNTFQNDYSKDNNLINLIRNLKKGTYDKQFATEASKQEFIGILEELNQLRSLQRSRDLLKADIKIEDIINEFSKLDTSKSPTLEQINAIIQMIALFKTAKAGKNDNYNFIQLLGTAGTGKTTLVVKTALNFLINKNLIKPESVLASGHTDTSATALGSSISIKNVDSLNNILSMKDEDLSKFELLVIDEAFAIPQSYLTALSNKIKGTKKEIKVILLGDYNQTKEEIGTNLFFNTFSSPISKVDTLTFNYRANINAIISASKQFENSSQKINTLNTISNNDESFLLAGEKLNGVLGSNTNNIIQAVKAQKSVRKDLQRVVIVTKESDKAKYLELEDENTKVLTVTEVQGQSIDEVYIDFSYDAGGSVLSFNTTTRKLSLKDMQKKDLNTDYAYNTFMNSMIYTAITRGKSFVYVYSKDINFSQEIDPSISSNVEVLEKELEHNKNYFKNFLYDLNTSSAELDDTFKSVNIDLKNDLEKKAEEAKKTEEKEETKKTKVEKEDAPLEENLDADTTIDEDVVETDDSTSEVIAVDKVIEEEERLVKSDNPDITLEGQSLRLHYPEGYDLSEVYYEGISYSPDLNQIKVVSMDIGGGFTSLMLLARTIQDPNKYIKLAVISQKDSEKYPVFARLFANTKNHISTTASKVITITEDRFLSQETFSIVPEETGGLSIRYDNYDITLSDEYEDNFAQVVDIFEKGFFQLGGLERQEYESMLEIGENGKKRIKLKHWENGDIRLAIATRNLGASGTVPGSKGEYSFSRNLGNAIVKHKGKPLLIIKTPKSKVKGDKLSDTKKSQAIFFKHPRMSSESLHLKTVQELLNKLDNIELSLKNRVNPFSFNDDLSGVDFDNPIFVTVLDALSELYTVDSDNKLVYNSDLQSLKDTLILNFRPHLVKARSGKLNEWYSSPYMKDMFETLKDEKGVTDNFINSLYDELISNEELLEALKDLVVNLHSPTKVNKRQSAKKLADVLEKEENADLEIKFVNNRIRIVLSNGDESTGAYYWDSDVFRYDKVSEIKDLIGTGKKDKAEILAILRNSSKSLNVQDKKGNFYQVNMSENVPEPEQHVVLSRANNKYQFALNAIARQNAILGKKLITIVENRSSTKEGFVRRARSLFSYDGSQSHKWKLVKEQLYDNLKELGATKKLVYVDNTIVDEGSGVTENISDLVKKYTSFFGKDNEALEALIQDAIEKGFLTEKQKESINVSYEKNNIGPWTRRDFEEITNTDEQGNQVSSEGYYLNEPIEMTGGGRDVKNLYESFISNEVINTAYVYRMLTSNELTEEQKRNILSILAKKLKSPLSEVTPTKMAVKLHATKKEEVKQTKEQEQESQIEKVKKSIYRRIEFLNTQEYTDLDFYKNSIDKFSNMSSSKASLEEWIAFEKEINDYIRNNEEEATKKESEDNEKPDLTLGDLAFNPNAEYVPLDDDDPLFRMKTNASVLGDSISKKDAQELVFRLLPSLNNTSLFNYFTKTSLEESYPNIQFISRATLRHMDKDGKETWGYVKNGIIYVGYEEINGEKIIHENVLRHEIFHHIFRHYLSDKQRSNLKKEALKEASKKGISLETDLEIEEYLAERFQYFRKNINKPQVKTISAFLRKLFKDILNLIGFIKDFSNDIDSLFNQIDNGVIKPWMFKKNFNDETAFMQIVTEDMNGNSDLALAAYEAVMKEVGELSVLGYKGVPLADSEIVEYAYKNLKSRLYEVNSEIISVKEELKNNPTDIVLLKELKFLQNKGIVLSKLIPLSADEKEIQHKRRIFNNIMSMIMVEIVESEDSILLDEFFDEEDLERFDYQNVMNKEGDFALKNEITNNEKISQRANLHTNLRIFFSTIPANVDFFDEEKTKMLPTEFLNSSFVFSKVSDIIRNLNLNNRKSLLDLLKRLEKTKEVVRSTKNSNVIFNKIEEMFKYAFSEKLILDPITGKTYELPTNVRFFEDYNAKRNSDLKKIEYAYAFSVRENTKLPETVEELKEIVKNQIIEANRRNIAIMDNLKKTTGNSHPNHPSLYKKENLLNALKEKIAKEKKLKTLTNEEEIESVKNRIQELDKLIAYYSEVFEVINFNFNSSNSLKKDTPMLEEMYERIQEIDKNIPEKEIFFQMYKKSKYLEIVKGIQNVFGSSRRTNYVIATTENKFGKIIKTYRAAKDMTGKDAIENKFISKFIDNLNGFESWQDMLDSNFTVLQKISEDLKDPSKQVSAINEFLKLGELSKKDFTLYENQSSLPEIVKKVSFIVDMIEKELGKEIVKNILGEDMIDGKVTIKYIVQDVQSSISFIIENVFNETNYAKEKMMTDAKGDRVSRDILSTNIDDTVKNVYLWSKSFEELLPSLKTRSIKKHNIFLQKKNKIHSEVLTHDAHRDENSKNVKSRSDENKSEYFRREFVSCFTDAIREGSFNEPTYHQTFFELEGRDRMQQVQINVLSRQDCEAGLLSIIQHIKERNKNTGSIYSVYNPLLNFQFKDQQGKNLLTYDGDNSTEISSRALNIDKENADVILQLVKSELKNITKNVTSTLITEEILFDYRLKQTVDRLNSVWKFSTGYLNFITNYANKDNSTNEAIFRSKRKGQYILTDRHIEELVEAWIYNNYVNKYFLNQLITGEFRQFKNGKDLVKRLLGPSSAGTKQLVSSKDKKSFGDPGSNRKYRAVVINDVTKTQDSIEAFLRNMITNSGMSDNVEEDVKDILNYFSEKGYELTDGASFMTVERQNDIRSGMNNRYGFEGVAKNMFYGTEAVMIPYATGSMIEINNILNRLKSKEEAFNVRIVKIRDENAQTGEKDLYELYTEEPITYYIKNSHIVLNDELTYKFPVLKRLREFLEYKDENHEPIQELIFKSSLKIGVPKKILNFEQLFSKQTVNGKVKYESIQSLRTQLENTDLRYSVLELSSANNRIQFNPQVDLLVEKNKIAIFSQIMYFINVNTKNPDRAKKAYAAQGYLLEKGLKEFEEKLEGDFASWVKSQLMKSPENAYLYELMQKGLSTDSLLLDRKIITILSSALSAIQFDKKLKFRGGKFTLQTPLGTESGKKARFDGTEGELSYQIVTDKDNKVKGHVGEAFLPKQFFFKADGKIPKDEYSKFIDADGNFINSYDSPFMLGFRLPSTEINNGILIKIVGWHTTNDSTIIVPPEVIAIMGSDHDIDSLFVVHRETVEDSKRSLNYTMDINEEGKVDLKDVVDENYEKGNPVGYYKKDDVYTFDPDKYLNDLYELRERIKKDLNTISSSKSIKNDQLWVINTLKKKLSVISSIEDKLLRNIIVDSVIETLNDLDNFRRMLVPISTNIIDSETDPNSIRNIFKDLGIEEERFEFEPNLCNPLEAYKMFKNVFDGASSTGIEANTVKVYAYMHRAGSDVENPPKVKEAFRYTYDDIEHDSVSEIEKRPEKENIKKRITWETMETMINISIDNPKGMLLYAINSNYNTINALNSMIMTGLPFEKAVLWINQPSILLMDEFRYRKNLRKSIDHISEDLMNAYIKISNLLETDSIKIDKEELSKAKEKDAVNEEKAQIDKEEISVLKEPSILKAFKGILKNKGLVLPKLNTQKMKYWANASRRGDLNTLLIELENLNEESYTKEQYREFLDMILYQFAVINEFRKPAALGDNVTKLSSFLSILRNYPVKIEDQFDILEKLNSIGKIKTLKEKRIEDISFTFEEQKEYRKENHNNFVEYKSLMSDLYFDTEANFGFDVPNFFASNPQVIGAYKSLKFVNETTKKQLLLYKSGLRDEIREVVKEKLKYIPSLSETSAKQSSEANLVELTRQVASSIYANVIYQKAVEKGIIKQEEIEVLDPDTNEILYLSGVERFLQEFTQKIKNVLAFESKNEGTKVENMFLSRLSISKTSNRLTVHDSVGIEGIELKKVQKSFELLAKYSFDENNNVTYNKTGKTQSGEDFMFSFYLYESLVNDLKNKKNNTLKFINSAIINEVDNLYIQKLKELKDNENKTSIIQRHIDNVIRKNHFNLKEAYKKDKASDEIEGYSVNHKNYDRITFKSGKKKLVTYKTNKTSFKITEFKIVNKKGKEDVRTVYSDMIYNKRETKKKGVYYNSPYYMKIKNKVYVKQNLPEGVNEKEVPVTLYSYLGRSSVLLNVSEEINPEQARSTVFAIFPYKKKLKSGNSLYIITSKNAKNYESVGNVIAIHKDSDMNKNEIEYVKLLSDEGFEYLEGEENKQGLFKYRISPLTKQEQQLMKDIAEKEYLNSQEYIDKIKKC